VIDDRPTTDLASWKISIGNISATGHPIYFMFGSSRFFGFGGSNGATSAWIKSKMAAVAAAAILKNFEWPYLRVWFYRKNGGENNSGGVIRLVTIHNIY